MGQFLTLPTAVAAPTPKILENTILVLPVSALDDYEHFGSWIDHVATRTTNRLLVFLVSALFDTDNGGVNLIRDWKPMERLISFVYTRASGVAVRLDRVLMRIDVVLHSGTGTMLNGVEGEKDISWNAVFVPENGVNIEHLPYWVTEKPLLLLERKDASDRVASHPDARSSKTHATEIRHPVVALGGTFDHLHAGHKILLSMAAWIASRKLIVGVTDDALLKNKSNRQVMETIEERKQGVRDFLHLFRPGIEPEVVSISDVYGPTATDPDIQALVVSKETIGGARSIATLRGERGLPALATYTIEVISGEAGRDLSVEEDAETLKTAKMGSTYIREWIVQHGLGGSQRA